MKKNQFNSKYTLLIIAGFIVALYLFNAGLFATKIPFVGQAEGTNGTVNPYYYAEAGSSTVFACAQNPLLLRYDIEPSATAKPSYIVTPIAGVLTGFVYSSETTNPSLTAQLPKTTKMWLSGNNIYVYKQNIGQLTGNCLVCTNFGSGVSKTLSTPGLCSAATDMFVKYRADASGFPPSSFAYYNGFGKDLIYYSSTGSTGIIQNCANSISTLYSASLVDSMNGWGLYLTSDKSHAYFCQDGNSIYKFASASAPSGFSISKSQQSGKYEIAYPHPYPNCTNSESANVNNYYVYTKGTVNSAYLVNTNVSGTIQFWNDGTTQGNNAYILSSKYVCSSDKSSILLQNCSNIGGSKLQYTCKLNDCAFSSSVQDLGNIPGVKCASKFIADSKVCVGNNTLYTVDSTGSSQSFTTCGYQCVNNDHCDECKSGWQKCSDDKKSTLICINGQYAPGTTCQGIETCKDNNYVANCSSGYNVSDELCGGFGFDSLQPIKFGIDKIWHANGDKCQQGCDVINNVATCRLLCPTPGYFCEAGQLQYCNNSVKRDYERNPISECTSGECTADGKYCKAKYSDGDTFCIASSVYKASSSGNLLDLNGGIKTSLDRPCPNGCNPLVNNTKATCVYATGCENNKGLDICVPNTQVHATCSVDGLSYTFNESCTSKGSTWYCDKVSGVAGCVKQANQCTPNIPFCYNGTSLKNCNSEGMFDGTTNNTCNNQGCYTDNMNGYGKCNNECTELDSYTCKADTNSYICKNVNGQQIYTLDQDCSSYNGCDTNTGKCKVQCSGSQICTGTGQFSAVYSCNAGKISSTPQYNCNGVGCAADGVNCKSECAIGDVSCFDTLGVQYTSLSAPTLSLAGQCTKATSGQMYYSKSNCGSMGCVAGTCTVGTPNAFFCDGNSIYQYDSNGMKPSTPYKICNVNSKIAGLTPMCLNGENDCQYCADNSIQCDGNTQYTCSNPNNPLDRTEVRSCEYSCSNTNGNYCDNITKSVERLSFNKNEGAISLKYIFKGSESKKGLVINSATLNLKGTGVDKTITGQSSGTTGEMTISGIGTLEKGVYNATLTLNNYGRSYVDTVTVTDSYTISILGSNKILSKVPNVPTTMIIEAKNGVNAPQSLVVASQSPGLTVTLDNTLISTQWQATLLAQPGTYNFTVTARDNGVDVVSQTFNDITINPAKLDVGLIIPNILSSGKHTFEFTVTAPNEKGLASPVNNAQVACYVNSQATQALATAVDGKYTCSYDFTASGTYYVEAKADMTNYASGSSGGNVVVSGGTGGTGTTTGNGTGTGTITPVPTGFVCCMMGNNTFMVIAQNSCTTVVSDTYCQSTTQKPATDNTLIYIIIGIIAFAVLNKKGGRKRR